MNTKNRLIEKLLRVAKRHKILTYPVLALVALISIFSYFFNWSTGAGKRVVAIIMVMVMLVSQSYFLTSSASGETDDVTMESSDGVSVEEPGNDGQDSAITTPSEEESNVQDDSQGSGDDANVSDGNIEDALAQDGESAEGLTDTSDSTPEGDMNTEDMGESEGDESLYDIPKVLADDAVRVQVVMETASGPDPRNNLIADATPIGNGQYRVKKSELEDVKSNLFASETYVKGNCYEYFGWYKDSACTQAIQYEDDYYIAKPESDGTIRVYARMELRKYKVTILLDDTLDKAHQEDYTGVENGIDNPTGRVATFYVAATGDAENPTGSFTVKNPTKKGYTITGVTFNDDKNTGGSQVDGTNLVVTLSGSKNYDQKISFKWENDVFYINYARTDDPNAPDTVPERAVYDKYTFATADVGVYPKPGYVFDHWTMKKPKVGDKDTEYNWDKIKPGTSITASEYVGTDKNLQDILYDDYKNQKMAVLYPAYTYLGIEKPDTKDPIVYQYNDPEAKSYEYEGSYTGATSKGSDSFSYSIESITVGESGSDIKGTIERDYGIVVNGGNSLTVRPVSGGPTKRTPDNGTPIIVTCKITDKNVTDSDPDNATNKETTFTVKIIVKKRLISLKDEQVPAILTKTYDGTTDCLNVEKAVSLETEIPGLVVKFKQGKYEKEDAGPQPVILEGDYGLYYEGDGNVDKDNYTLSENPTWTVPGLILQRPLYVKTSFEYRYDRKPQYVRAGEDNPIKVKVELDEQANKEDDRGLVKDHVLDEIIEYYSLDADDSKHIRGENDEELIGYKEGTVIHYTVEARAKEGSNIGKNYKIVFDTTSGRNTKASYELRLEEPIEGTNYEFRNAEGKTITLVGDYWLAGETIQIVPKSGYDRIRFEGDELWSTAIELNEKNTEDGTITIQLRDSSTGAFTSWKLIELKVDAKGPDYVKVTVEDGYNSNPGDGFYFPSKGSSVSFGNYFNKTITLVVTYQDNRSYPKNLYYRFSGTLGSSEVQMQPFGKADKDGYATASFEILAVNGLDKRGTIEVYADDNAGNESTPVNLKCQNVTGDEWAVETSDPKIIDNKITVKSGEITVKNNSDNYYANCTAYLTAKDVTSGIYGVTWYVNGKQVPKRVTDTSKKLEDATFELPINDKAFPTEDGYYELYATVTDNAGNVSEPSNSFNFWVDDVPPILEVDDDYKDKVVQQIRITFRAYDELSGIDQISVYDENGKLYGKQVVTERQETSADGKYTIYHCYFDVSESGVYKIVVKDKAGNSASEIVNLGGVSADMPRCPEVTFNPEPNEKGWITSKEAKAHLENVTLTKNEEMEAATHYRWWLDGESEPRFASSISNKVTYADVKLPEGIVHLRVWAQSDTGVECAGAQSDSHLYELYIDGTAPKIAYQLQRGAGNSLLVTFTITDNVKNVEKVSGVDKDTIKVLHGNEPMLISLKELESGDGYTGSFVITEGGNYTIQAADIAGNVSDVEAFSPMSMKLNAVKNLTDRSATVGAKIYKGTHAIKAASIAYRKSTDTDYTQTDAMPILDTASGNMTISAVLTGLASGMDYVYKVTAVSEGNEVIEYEGYFRTLSSADKGVTITGVARYADNRSGFITVDLIRGNNNIRAIEMEVGSDKDNIFTFTKVPDGSYNLVATGYEQSEPDKIYTKSLRVLVEDGRIIYPEEGISLILAGVSASTSVDIETKDTPDVSAEFNWMDNLLTDEDRELMENGGTVEYQLNAKMIRITNIETAALSAMYAVAGTNKVVGAYLDLTLYKIVTDEDGNVTKKPVSELMGGASVSVTIPLGDMTGKSGLMVVRIHQSGSNYTGRYLPDQDINPSTYTVTTNQFSTYAVLYDRNQITDTTPGNSGRGDTVINGNNTSSVKKDVTAVEMSTDNDNSNNNNTTPGSSSNPKTSVGSLRNASSAKTGDETPIALAGIMMMFAMGGFVVLRKKANKN